MKVYLFSDYLKTIHGAPLHESQAVCDIATMESFPDSLVRIGGKLARVCMISQGYLCIEFMGEMPQEEEINGAENITCPYCGNEDGDSWERSDSDDADECGDCKSVFSYEREVTVTYSSKIVERNDKVVTLN